MAETLSSFDTSMYISKKMINREVGKKKLVNSKESNFKTKFSIRCQASSVQKKVKCTT